jgi:hypothetical protein
MIGAEVGRDTIYATVSDEKGETSYEQFAAPTISSKSLFEFWAFD